MKKLQAISILVFALSASITTVAASNKLLLECKKGEEGQVIAYDVLEDFSGARHLTKTSSAGREYLLRNAQCEFDRNFSCLTDHTSTGGDLTIYVFEKEVDGTYTLVSHAQDADGVPYENVEPLFEQKFQCQFFGL
jgi:hypothetical protein